MSEVFKLMHLSASWYPCPQTPSSCPLMQPVHKQSVPTVKTYQSLLYILEIWPIFPNSLGASHPPLTLQVPVTITNIASVFPLLFLYSVCLSKRSTHDSISSNSTYQTSHLSQMLLDSRFWPLQLLSLPTIFSRRQHTFRGPVCKLDQAWNLTHVEIF